MHCSWIASRSFRHLHTVNISPRGFSPNNVVRWERKKEKEKFFDKYSEIAFVPHHFVHFVFLPKCTNVCDPTKRARGKKECGVQVIICVIFFYSEED